MRPLCKISRSPPDPLKPVNRELRPQEAEPSEVVVLRKLRNENAVPMSQKIPENSPGPVAPSYGQNSHFRPQTWLRNFCPQDPPKTSKSRIAAAGGLTIESRESTKVAQRSPGSVEPKIPENSPVAPSYGQKTCSMGGVKHRTSPPRPKSNQWCKPIGT